MAINSKALRQEVARYGLSPAALRALGDRAVTVELYVGQPPLANPTRTQLARMATLQPMERARLLDSWRDKRFERLRLELPDPEATVVRFNRARIGLRIDLPARAVSRLLRLRHADRIRIVSIRGRNEVPVPAKSRLFTIRGRMVEVEEGRKGGLQTFEERIIVLEARSEEQARRRATTYFQRQ